MRDSRSAPRPGRNRSSSVAQRTGELRWERFLYELKAGPAGGRLRRPSSRRQRRDGHRGASLTVQPSRHRHHTLIDTLSSPGHGAARFRACQRERPRLQAAATGPCGDWGASVSGRQRRLERRLPRRLWRSRWARRFPMAEPACLAISSRKARSGSQRISKRHPASSHHRDRVHTLAPRPTRGIGFNGGTGATKKRPACARRSASVALFWAHSDDYSPTLSIGQAIGQVSWSTAVGLPAVAAASGQSDHRRSPPGSPAAGSRRRIPRHKRSAGKGCVALVRTGSVEHRKPLVLGGHQRSTSV
jgi:hypothetical protein